MTEVIEDILNRYKSLKSDRANWEGHWEEVATFCAPRRLGFSGARTPGEKRTRSLYNPIGVQCTQTLSAALHGMVMNPATAWMALRMVDDDVNEQDNVRKWLSDATKRMMTALQSPQTTFHTHANQVLEDMAAFGTACMYVGQKKTGPIYVRAYSVAEIMIGEDQYGSVDTVIRESEYTVRQLIQAWGDKVSEKVKKFHEQKKLDEKIKVIHCVKPRKDYDPQRKTPENMPWATVYAEIEGEHILQESGVEEMPYVVPRWSVACGEVYGRSPAMTALPQIKLANVAQKTLIEAAEKAVNPPLMVPHEGIVSPIRTTPGGLTYVRGKNEIQQMPTSSNLPFAAEWLQAVNNEIRTSMFVDQVQFVGDFKMTATEVMQRSTERMRLLGPVLGRLENEFLNPLINRVFGIMTRLGAMPEPPEEIQDQELRVEYVSPLARAQKSSMAQGFQMALATLAPLMENPQLGEQILAPLDMDKLLPMVFDWYGVDQDLLKDDEQLEAAAQAQAQRQQMQMIPSMAKAVADGAGGVKSLAGAGRETMEMQALAAPPVAAEPGTAASVGGGGAGAPPSAPPGNIDLMSLLGALTKGGAQAAPAAVGGPQQYADAAAR